MATLSRSLVDMGVKHLSSFRAKQLKSLRKKLERDRSKLRKAYRLKERQRLTHRQVINGTKDLAGIRIALYFPSDSMMVESCIFKLFKGVTIVEHPPKDGKPKPTQQRFEGYSARHYWVNSEIPIILDDRSNMEMKVEVQVASVLMHAWSEVEHDLVYKPGAKELDFDERTALDALIPNSPVAGPQVRRGGF